MYIRASYFISFNKYTNTQVIILLQFNNIAATANDDEMIIFLIFVAHLQVTILKHLQTANDSVRYSSRSALLIIVRIILGAVCMSSFSQY